MKDFFVSFLIVLILLFVLFFFAGTFILENFWLILTLCALLISLVIHSFYRQSEKIEELEKRIEILEGEKNGS